MLIWNTFWGSRVNNGDTIEIVANKIMDSPIENRSNKSTSKIRRDIFFKTKG